MAHSMTLLELRLSARDCAAEARRALYMKRDPRMANLWAEVAAQWLSILRARIAEAASPQLVEGSAKRNAPRVRGA